MLASLLMEWQIYNALLPSAKREREREREREGEKKQKEDNKTNISLID